VDQSLLPLSMVNATLNSFQEVKDVFSKVDLGREDENLYGGAGFIGKNLDMGSLNGESLGKIEIQFVGGGTKEEWKHRLVKKNKSSIKMVLG
jgi:hypothetical protein